MADEVAKCLTPSCDGVPRNRGLCNHCYQEFRKAVNAGMLTDEAAIAAGLVLPAKIGRRHSSKWFVAFEARLRKAQEDAAKEPPTP